MHWVSKFQNSLSASLSDPAFPPAVETAASSSLRVCGCDDIDEKSIAKQVRAAHCCISVQLRTDDDRSLGRRKKNLWRGSGVKRQHLRPQCARRILRHCGIDTVTLYTLLSDRCLELTPVRDGRKILVEGTWQYAGETSLESSSSCMVE